MDGGRRWRAASGVLKSASPDRPAGRAPLFAGPGTFVCARSIVFILLKQPYGGSRRSCRAGAGWRRRRNRTQARYGLLGARREAAMRNRLERSQLRKYAKTWNCSPKTERGKPLSASGPVTGFAFLMPLHLAHPAQPSSPPPPRQNRPKAYLFTGPLLSSSLCVAGVGSFRPVSLCTSLAFLHCGSASRRHW